MLTRVSDNLKFKTMTDNLYKVQSKYADMEEKLATQKEVNRPSDNPVGMGKILDYRATRASIAKYQKNIDSAESWLNITESKLSSMQDQIVQASEIALAQGTATANESTRRDAAASLQPIIDELLSLANSKLGNRYLFSGSRTDVEPFSSAPGGASVGTAQTPSGNSFDGSVLSGGTYTGTTNKTYAVKIVTGGTLANATYKVSSDGGKTWGAEQTDLDTGTITLGDGVTMTFTDSGSTRLTANDLFYTHAVTAGYYRGNGEGLTVETSKDINFVFNMPGESVLTDKGDGTVDLFTVLNDLKTALETNDVNGIRNQINRLENARQQVSQYTSKCGSKMNGLDISKTNLSALDEKISSLNSSIEDADMAALITDFKLKETALKASYAIAGEMGSFTILDYIK